MSRPTTSDPSQRMLRVGEQVRHALSETLQRGEVIDPVIENSVVSVSEVRMSPDLKIATAFVSPLSSSPLSRLCGRGVGGEGGCSKRAEDPHP